MEKEGGENSGIVCRWKWHWKDFVISREICGHAVGVQSLLQKLTTRFLSGSGLGCRGDVG